MEIKTLVNELGKDHKVNYEDDGEMYLFKIDGVEIKMTYRLLSQIKESAIPGLKREIDKLKVT